MISKLLLACFVVLALVASAATFHVTQQQQQKAKKIMFIPLDERFTTRDIFLNMAKITPYEVVTPPVDIISLLKVPANLTALDEWVEDNIDTADFFVISSELYLYGGLIQSRISNNTQEFVEARLQKLVDYKWSGRNPNLRIYLSNVIMRIPDYNLDFEEPWYWSYWGVDLFEWSFYTDRYNVLGNPADKQTADQLAQQIPASVMHEFLWRRSRNHNITLEMINQLQQWNQKYGPSGSRLFEMMWITSDDSAVYGLNKAEERELKALVTKLNMWDQINMYYGADEVGLTMLSKMSVDAVTKPQSQPRNSNRFGRQQFLHHHKLATKKKQQQQQQQQASPTTAPLVFIVYRNSTTQDYVPNYEGQALNISIQAQLAASGAVITNSVDQSDIILLVNNWDTTHQQEATYTQTAADYTPFLPYLKLNKIIIYADIRYSNGGDQFFVQWIYQQPQPAIGAFTYAGWNTAGNTLGTCISNAVLLYLFPGEQATQANQLFTAYRFIEDLYYQSSIRQYLSNYVTFVATTDSISDLAVDLPFYERFVFKGFAAVLNTTLSDEYPVMSQYVLESVYFPWNRTFEIGMNITVAAATPSTKTSAQSEETTAVGPHPRHVGKDSSTTSRTHIHHHHHRNDHHRNSQKHAAHKRKGQVSITQN